MVPKVWSPFQSLNTPWELVGKAYTRAWGGAQQTVATSPPGDSDTGSVVLPEVLTRPKKEQQQQTLSKRREPV